MNPACEHGILRRQCPYCELDELRREVERLREERDRYARGVIAQEQIADRYREALEYFAALRGDTLIIDINRRAQRALQRDSDDMSEM